jgi:dihydroneopterin aldolase
VTAVARSDVLALRGLRVAGRHGVLESERSIAQDFVVDAALFLDTASAAAGDHLADTVDYVELAQRLAAVIAGPPVGLIETLAQRLADTCLADPRVREVEVCVHKPRAAIGHPFDDVSVTIRRGRP